VVEWESEKMAEVKKLDENSALDRQLTRLWKQARDVRGLFLEQAIFIENLIGDIISWHFCPDEDRRNLFFSLIINNPDFTFSSKIKVLRQLLKLRYPELDKKCPEVIKELEKVIKFRNKVAHRMLDSSEQFLAKKLTDRIQLVYFKDGQEKHEVVTVKDMQERLKACSRLVLTIVDIQKEVIQRVQVKDFK